MLISISISWYPNIYIYILISICIYPHISRYLFIPLHSINSPVLEGTVLQLWKAHFCCFGYTLLVDNIYDLQPDTIWAFIFWSYTYREDTDNKQYEILGRNKNRYGWPDIYMPWLKSICLAWYLYAPDIIQYNIMQYFLLLYIIIYIYTIFSVLFIYVR